MAKYFGLHSHSNSSLGDGLNRAEEHFKFVLENAGEDSGGLCLSDHGNGSEWGYILQAKNAFKKKGIKFKAPFAVEAYIHPDLDEWQKVKDGIAVQQTEDNDLVVEVEGESKGKFYDPLKRRHHLVIIAKNKAGYKNLCRLITESYRRGFYRFPRMDFKSLEKHREGLIISTSCLAGLPYWLIGRDKEKGEEVVLNSLKNELQPLLDIFGKENAYLELQFNKLPEQKVLNDYLIKYSKISGHKLICTTDSHFARPEWWREREIYRLLAQQSKGFDVSIDDLPKSIDELKCQLYPKNFDQMFDSYIEMYPESDVEQDILIGEALERTYEIGHHQIEEYDPDNSMKLPTSFLKGADPNDELEKLCKDALSNLKDINQKKYQDRLNLELSVIKKKNFSLYFLTLKKAFDEIKKELIVGAARGSGGGSLVCYLLGITLLDPIKHDLLFERFLSENRNEFPDIDSDIEDRDAALNILRKSFGEENVIAISNFNLLQLKSLVKDISKLYGIPFEEVNAVTSIMETEARQPILDSVGGDQKLYVFDLDGAKAHSPTFGRFIEKYPKVAESIDVLFRQARSIGKHAGGVLLTENAQDNMPIIKIRGEEQTPWGEGLTAKHLEQFGFVKYDFLGIATLRMIRRCIERVLKNKNQKVSFENIKNFFMEHLHPDVIGQGEPEVFENVYQKGRFCGTFQFTEKNAQSFCVQARPENINDIATITSIYRPGPLASKADKKYVHFINNPEDISYDHPILKEVLQETKSQLCYQEQFMLLANKLAGFSLVEADELRKLLVKPVTTLGEEMKAKRIEVGKKFINGCIQSGMNKDRAERLWSEEILGFISYGFNKSHAIAYAYLSYQCAYLFHYFPDAWVCSYLENDNSKEAAMAECEAVGYLIGGLDILKSGIEYSVGDDKIILPPLNSVKGIGEAAVEELIKLRSTWKNVGDAYLNFDSFFYNTESKTLKNGNIKTKKEWKFTKFNKRALDALIRLESMDSLGLFPDLFLNHAHMKRCLIDNWDQKDKQKFEIKELAQKINSSDFKSSERVSAQEELLGTYDKSLLITAEVIDMLSSAGMLPLSDICDTPLPIWFILKSFETKQTQTKKTYYKLTAMDIDGKELIFNYFNFAPKSGWKEKGIYYGELFRANGWINTKKGTYIQELG